MRLVLLLAVLGPFSSFFAAAVTAPAERERTVPAFRVVSSQRDPKLKKNESVFEFHILNTEYHQTTPLPPISASCNGSAYDFTPDAKGIHALKVAPGKYTFQFYANFSYYEIYSDSVAIKPGFRTVVHLYFLHSDTGVTVDKPVIYLYPPVDITASVAVNPVGKCAFTYPAYANGWTGIAHPDGSMTIAGKTYPYLFWEADMPFAPRKAPLTEGFIVPAENTVAFLESVLTQMGLSTREQTDFITYWGPKMAGSDRNLVRFLFNDDCNAFAQLTVTPQPAQLFRVYMLWTPLSPGTAVSVQPQQLPAVDRTGFYAIEWGGSEVPLQQAPVSEVHR